MPRLFEPFYKTKNKDSQKANPSGNSLGLSICKEILRGHGGDITVVSKLGEGSTFFVTMTTEKYKDAKNVKKKKPEKKKRSSNNKKKDSKVLIKGVERVIANVKTS